MNKDLNKLCKCGHRKGAHNNQSAPDGHCHGADKDGIPFGQPGHKYEQGCACVMFEEATPVKSVTEVCVCGHTFHHHTAEGKPASQGCLAIEADGSFCPCKLFEIPYPNVKDIDKYEWDSLKPFMDKSKTVAIPVVDSGQWEELNKILKESESLSGVGILDVVDGSKKPIQKVTLQFNPKDILKDIKEYEYYEAEAYNKYIKQDWKSTFNPDGWGYGKSLISMSLPPKEFLDHQELQRAHAFMKYNTKLTSMSVNGIQLEHLMAAYAIYRHQDMEERFEQRVKERVQEELKKKHKGDCIPSFRKRDRKFRNS